MKRTLKVEISLLTITKNIIKAFKMQMNFLFVSCLSNSQDMMHCLHSYLSNKLKGGYPIIFASNVFHNSHLNQKCIQNQQQLLWKTFDTKMIGWSHFRGLTYCLFRFCFLLVEFPSFTFITHCPKMKINEEKPRKFRFRFCLLSAPII